MINRFYSHCSRLGGQLKLVKPAFGVRVKSHTIIQVLHRACRHGRGCAAVRICFVNPPKAHHC